MSYNRYAALSVITSLLTALPSLAHGQTKRDSATDLGWGSSWTAPVNDQQRQTQAFIQQCETASKAHDFQKELELCDRQLQKEPNSVAALAVRADAHRHLKKYGQALADVDRARDLTRQQNLPTATAELWSLRAHVHASAGDYPAALEDLHVALRTNETDPAILNDLAWLRATAPDEAVRNGRDGVRLAHKAITLLPKPTSYSVTDTLAAAYAEANDYSHAVDCEKRAMSDANGEIKDSGKAQRFQKEAAERLQLFEQHQPYHAAAP